MLEVTHIRFRYSTMDPLQWFRKPVDNAEWNTYGVCESENTFGKACGISVIVLNILALLAACYQAYKARELGSEFSESKNIGIALYSWFQLLLVSVPVLFITADDNVEARYFLQIGIIFAVCATMLVCLFAPLLVRQGRSEASSRSVHERRSSNFQRSTGFGSGAELQDTSTSFRIAARVSGRNSGQFFAPLEERPRQHSRSDKESKNSANLTSEMSVQFAVEEECNPTLAQEHATIGEDGHASPGEAVAHIDNNSVGVSNLDEPEQEEVEEETIIFETDKGEAPSQSHEGTVQT